MVQPMEAAILQGVRDILFHSGWEMLNICIGEPGIFKVADVETKLHSLHLEAGDPQSPVLVSEVHLIVAVIAEQEIENGQMPHTNSSIGRFISI